MNGTTKDEKLKCIDLKVDYSYQRLPNDGRIKKIADEWDVRKANIIHVSRRPDGDYIMDGNHTVKAAIRVGVEELPCRIYENLTIFDEARLFAEINAMQKKITFNESLKARAFQGEEPYKTYLRILDDIGIPYTLSSGARGKLACHASLLSIFKKTTPHLMERALRVGTRAADGREEFFSVGFFPGICSAVVRHPEIDDSRLVVSVRKTPLSKIRDLAEAFRKTLTSNGGNSQTANYRKAFISIYNKNLKCNRIA